LESQSAALVAAVFVDFPKNKYNPSAASYEEFFSWGSHLHCPMKVGAYDNHYHIEKMRI